MRQEGNLNLESEETAAHKYEICFLFTAFFLFTSNFSLSLLFYCIYLLAKHHTLRWIYKCPTFTHFQSSSEGGQEMLRDQIGRHLVLPFRQVKCILYRSSGPSEVALVCG